MPLLIISVVYLALSALALVNGEVLTWVSLTVIALLCCSDHVDF